MGCTRSLLKIWGKCTVISFLVLSLWLPSPVWAAFASQFSLSVGEQYNDNIFFAKKKEHDSITIITPTLHLYYAPTGQAEPTLNLNNSPRGKFTPRNSKPKNFGKTPPDKGESTYHYPPPLRLNLTNTSQRKEKTQ